MRMWIVGCVLASVLMLAVGCEKVQTTATLVVTPASVQVARDGVAQFTVSLPETERESRDLYFPLTWTLSDPTLGTITNAAANTAVYAAGTGEGVNTVIVRDRSGAEGMAVITQVTQE